MYSARSTSILVEDELEAMDTDNDGVVTREECEAAKDAETVLSSEEE